MQAPRVGLLAAFAGTKLLIYLLLAGRYGYFRDEPYFLDCGRHLDWGYVDHAPMIGLVSRIALLLGGSLHALRLFPAIAGASLVVLTMLMTWRLGGNRFAPGLAGLSVLLAPEYLGSDSIHSTAFFGVAVVIGLLLTAQRREFLKPWIWIAGVIALAIFSPNLAWQIHRNFPTLEDLHNVAASGKNVILGPGAFIIQQIMMMHPVLFPVWLAGLAFFW